MGQYEKLDVHGDWEEEQSYGDEKRESRIRKLKLFFGASAILAVVLLVWSKSPSNFLRSCVHRHESPAIVTVEDGITHIKLNPLGEKLTKRIIPRQAAPPTYIPSNTTTNRTGTCTTAECNEYAKGILSNLAPNYTAIDPCEDFSTFACAGWRSTHDYRPDQSSVSIGSIMDDTVSNLLHALLESEYADNSTFQGENRTADRENFDKMKTGYNTCMDLDSIKEYGVEPVADSLEEFEKIYPPTGAAPAEDKAGLTKAITWLAKQNIGALVTANPAADDQNPDVQILNIGNAGLGLPKEYYNNSGIMANYSKSIGEIAQVIQTGKPIYEAPIDAAANGTLSAYANGIVGFEKLLSIASATPTQSQDVKYYYVPKTVAEIEQLVPEIGFTEWLVGQVPEGYPITPNRTVLLLDINYYKQLSEIIKKTNRQTMHDYFKSNLINSWAGRLHPNYTLPLRQFNNQLAGKDPNNLPDRWRTCINSVSAAQSFSLGAAYIERAFTADDKKLGDRIISDIKNIFAQRLKGFEWMSESVKNVAADKVVNIMQKIGYQTANPNLAVPTEVRDKYSNLDIGDVYWENSIAARDWGLNDTWNNLLAPTDRNHWFMDAQEVNAYYNPSGNEIVFPAGIMQLPVFSSKLPEYVSYGAFGAVAGHELTHGFDNHGSEYNEKGVYQPWWDNSTRANFDQRSQCFVGQYSKYTVPGLDGKPLNVNGELTLGENIADAGGISASFTAWKQREGTEPNQALPGLEKFSNDQLFFVAYGTWWCGKVRPERAVNLVYTDPHSPADKRILGTLANSANFREAFNCPVKQPTCQLW